MRPASRPKTKPEEWTPSFFKRKHTPSAKVRFPWASAHSKRRSVRPALGRKYASRERDLAHTFAAHLREAALSFRARLPQIALGHHRLRSRGNLRLLWATAAVVSKAESAAERRLVADGPRRGPLRPNARAQLLERPGRVADDDAGCRLSPVTPGRFRLPGRPDLGARSVRRRPGRARAPCPGPAPC
jgi:hypothetical protein